MTANHTDQSPALPDPVRQLYPFESRFLDLDSHRLHYVDEGQGTPVIMVHGNPTWSFYYRNVVAALKDSFRCIAVDNIGCGLSDKPQDYPYRLERHIDNLRTLVESLQLKEFHLVVHDWGGPIGLGMARLLPDRLRKLVVLNTSGFLSKRIPWRIAVCRWPLIGPFAVRGFNAFAGAAKGMAVEKKLPRDVAQGLLWPYGNWHDRIATLRFVQDIPMNPNHPTWPTMRAIEDFLPQLADHEMLLAWGMRDWCFSPHFLQEFRERCPHAQVIEYADAGHYVLEDEREVLPAKIREFLL